MQALNIQIYVDVVQLLLDRDPQHAAFMFDDSSWGGDGKGTSHLRSPILPGQLVRWTVTPVDVQTPIWISRIEFGPKGAALASAEPPEAHAGPTEASSPPQAHAGPTELPGPAEANAGPADISVEAQDAPEAGLGAPPPWSAPVWAKSWDGFVPAWSLTCGAEYPYRLVFSFGGVREIEMEGPALVFPTAMSFAEEPTPEDPAVVTKEA